jgi:hypothetical protein
MLMDPLWAGDCIFLTQILDGSSDKASPAMLFWHWCWPFRRWLGDQFGAAIYSIHEPFIDKIAKCYPRLFACTDLLVGASHRLQRIV